MHSREHNRKVAVARWKTVHRLEKSKFKNDLLSKAILCGFLAGDGSVQKRESIDGMHYQIDFFPDDLLMLRKYVELLGSVYCKMPSILDKGNYFCVRLTSKSVVLDMLAYCSFGINKWTVPDFVKKDEKLAAAWLSAFFSCEGYVSYNCIRIQTVNKQGMLEVMKLLDMLNIVYSYYEYAPKVKNHSKNYIINISKKSERLIFLQRVGFWHSTKQALLRKTLSL